MADNDILSTTALVTGASRGFGRGIATALSKAGARVVGVARDRDALEALRTDLGESFTPVTADATDPMTAGLLIGKYRPGVLVLNAGATPLPHPVHHHTWETFSRNWDVDVAHVFHWTREALMAPLAPGSTVVTLSSGAALFGSPLSGGYAGAKWAIRWLTSYAADESRRADLGIRFVSLLPQLTPATDLGAVFASAYASREGEKAAARGGPGGVLTPEQVGAVVTGLASGEDPDSDAYLVTVAGLRPLPGTPS
jgi:NAD(P)-dependent dehydrogenase (short-subunit alcohol dehydrogenase family)